MSNSVEIHNLSKDINMDETRGRSMAPNPISSRATSTHSNTLFIPYVNRIETIMIPPGSIELNKRIFNFHMYLSREGIQTTRTEIKSVWWLTLQTT